MSVINQLYVSQQERSFLLTDLLCYNPEKIDNIFEDVNTHMQSCISLKIEKKEEILVRSGVIFMIPNENVEQIKFLVVKGQSKNGLEGVWSIPKGRQSYQGEDNETCAIREVFEETGIKLDKLNHLPKTKIAHNIYYKYLTVENEFTNFQITDTSEVEKVEWKTIGELRTMNCNKDLRSILLYPIKKYSYHSIIFG
jgi:8-oxo-dGTP pyrophosphatase MutT (NUDIX family)